MSKPARYANTNEILSPSRTFFVTTNTSMGRRLLQSERNALLLIEVLRANVKAGKFRVLDFVVMPDHVHLLISVNADMTIEKAIQLIKGGFSYRLKREFGYMGKCGSADFQKCASRINAAYRGITRI
jgi:putative transposase